MLILQREIELHISLAQYKNLSLVSPRLMTKTCLKQYIRVDVLFYHRDHPFTTYIWYAHAKGQKTYVINRSTRMFLIQETACAKPIHEIVTHYSFITLSTNLTKHNLLETFWSIQTVPTSTDDKLQWNHSLLNYTE